ncbi:MAG: hypothetical protein K2X77_33380 [Candidatus Obscuribacterales bacterium]|nr:hypothetical protein [Candidatus Obscuribacterales bacterium]
MTNRKRKRRKERAAQMAQAAREAAAASIDELELDEAEAPDEENENGSSDAHDSSPSQVDPNGSELDRDTKIQELAEPPVVANTHQPAETHDKPKDTVPEASHEFSLSEERNLVEILNRVFCELDKNHDNVLSRPEIDMAVIDRHLEAEDAVGVSVLKSTFEEVKDLHKEGWFARKNGVTLADLLAFEQIILMEGQAVKRTDHEKMRESVRITTRHAQRALRAHRKLYANMDNPEKSIRPEAIRQGIVGDCYFLSALASIASTNPAMIKWMITPLEDNYYQVVFAGCMEAPIVVQEPTAVELALYAKVSEYGMWPAVIEKAYGVFLQQHRKIKTVIPAAAADAAESVYEAFDLLTGQMGHWEALPLLSNEKLKEILDSAFKERRAVAAATPPGKNGYTAESKLPAQHAFSVIGWNPRKEEITLRNPWGRVSDMCTIFENADGIFTINVNLFRRNFIALYYEDWAPDENIEDGDLPI